MLFSGKIIFLSSHYKSFLFQSLNVNEFLRPVEGQNYNRSEGRGRARSTNHGQGGQTRGHFIGRPVSCDAEVPLINDSSHFPTLAVN